MPNGPLIDKSSSSNDTNVINEVVKVSLKILHQNINSLASKIDSLEITIAEIDPDVLILTEHKMKEHQISRLNILNYNIYSYFARSSMYGGGVIVLGKTSIKGREIISPSIKSLLKDQVFELCLTEICAGDCKILIGGIYRSPISVNVKLFLEKLNTVLSIIINRYKYVVICGDININTLSNDSSVTELKHVLKQCNMRYLINYPTRITVNTQSAIDNVITNIGQSQIKVECISTLLSDHEGQFITIFNHSSNNKQPSKYLFKNSRKFSYENMVSFNKALELETWTQLYTAPDNLKYDIFIYIFLQHFHTHFPIVKTRKHLDKKPWFTEELKLEKNCLINESNAARRSKSQINIILVKHKISRFKNKLTQEKKKYYGKKIEQSKNYQRTTWNIINSEIGNAKPSNNNICLKCNDN